MGEKYGVLPHQLRELEAGDFLFNAEVFAVAVAIENQASEAKSEEAAKGILSRLRREAVAEERHSKRGQLRSTS